jgi:hypothetical protein
VAVRNPTGVWRTPNEGATKAEMVISNPSVEVVVRDDASTDVQGRRRRKSEKVWKKARSSINKFPENKNAFFLTYLSP